MTLSRLYLTSLTSLWARRLRAEPRLRPDSRIAKGTRHVKAVTRRWNLTHSEINTHQVIFHFLWFCVFSLKEEKKVLHDTISVQRKVQSWVCIAKVTSFFFFARFYCCCVCPSFVLSQLLKNQYYNTCFLKIKLYIFKWNVDVFLNVKAANKKILTVNPRLKALKCCWLCSVWKRRPVFKPLFSAKYKWKTRQTWR